jgi:acetolactate synthase-1/2/3 large subunit
VAVQPELELLAERLHSAGVRQAFGVTGSGPSWALITALEDRGVCYYPASHEAAAAMMAGAAARATGAPVPSISIKGPGLAHMLGGIVANHYENAPALSIAEAYADEAPVARRHKRLDQPTLVAKLVKACASLSDLDDGWESLLRSAREEAPGPVHVELAAQRRRDILSEEDGAGPLRDPPEAPAGRLLDLVARSNNPVVIAGSLATRRGWGSLLDGLRIPVFTTCAAKGVLPEDRPHAAGVFTGDGRSLSTEASILPAADLVIGVGLRGSEILSPRPFPAPYVGMDEIRGGSEGLSPAAESIDSEEGRFRELLESLTKKEWGVDSIASANLTMRRELLEAPWSPAACFEVLNRWSRPHQLVPDTGSFCTIAEHLWRAGVGRRFMGSSNGRFMGVALPTAIGLATCEVPGPTICAVGDGGVRMYLAELRLAVEKRLPICVLLMSDGRYGSIAAAAPAERRSANAIQVPGSSWWKVVEAFGCEAARVTTVEDLGRTLDSWPADRPIFLEAVFPPQDYAALTRQLR